MNQDTDSGFAMVAAGIALASVLLTFLTFQVTGLILGLAAIAIGGLGLVLAVRHHLSDRNKSIVSILLGTCATVLALIVLIF